MPQTMMAAIPEEKIEASFGSLPQAPPMAMGALPQLPPMMDMMELDNERNLSCTEIVHSDEMDAGFSSSEEEEMSEKKQAIPVMNAGAAKKDAKPQVAQKMERGRKRRSSLIGGK